MNGGQISKKRKMAFEIPNEKEPKNGKANSVPKMQKIERKPEKYNAKKIEKQFEKTKKYN